MLLDLRIFITSFLLLFVGCYAQYNFCYMPAGCRGDECCFPVITKFGPNCYTIQTCTKPFKGDCCFNARVVQLYYGYVYGFAQLLDDEYGYRDNGDRYLSIYLGVRYAKAPSRELNLRFKKPEPLDNSQQKILAIDFGPSCPQDIKHLNGLRNPVISEDCLNMNIYVLNDTRLSKGRKTLYPIMVFLHGGEHKYGSANLYPGHVLAQQGIMVVTVNYRLGPFGFLSTEDAESWGNYGLWDQLAALEFLKANAEKFFGDPTTITLVGHETGAADVALHTLRLKVPLFKRAVLLGGSDLMIGGFVTDKGEAKRYSQELGYQIGCNSLNSRELIDCLALKEYSELAQASDKVKVHGANWKSLPWSPSLDKDFISDFPENLRRQGMFHRMRVFGGLTESDGSLFAERRYPNISSGVMNLTEFKRQVDIMLEEDIAQDRIGSLYDVTFEYMYWPQPVNDSWRLRKFIELWTDRRIGSGLDIALKSYSDALPLKNWTQLYVFKYKSETDPKCSYLGAYHGSDLQYIFGFPYFNDSGWQSVGLKHPSFYYAKLDINMSDYMIYFFTNFVKMGNATPDIIRNLTWDTYRPNNRTYFLLDLHNEFVYDFDLLQDYRIRYYAFWDYYYSRVIGRLPRFSTPFPTPLYLEHLKISTFALLGIMIVLLIILAVLVIILLRKRRDLR